MSDFALEFTGQYDATQRNFDALQKDLPLVVSPPQARVYNNANLAIATGTVTTVTFNSERFDNGNLHDTSSNTSRLTAPVAGLYQVGGHGVFASNATGRRQMLFRVNGSTIIAIQEWDTNQGAETSMSLSTLYRFDAGEYVEMRVFQNSGGNLNLSVVSNYSPEFWMVRLGSYGA